MQVKIEMPLNVKKILAMLSEHGFDAYIVGGCVRDSLIKRIPGDWDITTSAKPEEIKKIFRRTVDTGIEHGTVTVLMGDEAYEVTTYRLDGDYSDNRHPDSVTFTDKLSEDLMRRDFTINAMAYSEKDGLVDLFGGINDLDNHIIRCVGNAEERFKEDALRILRAVRFAAQLDYEISRDTFAAIKHHIPNLANVSKERIFNELSKTLLSNNPEKAELIWETGMETGISETFRRIDQSSAKRLKGAGYLPKEKYIRFAALMQDIPADTSKQILRELKADNDTINRTAVLVDVLKDRTPLDPVAIRRMLRDIGPDLFDDMLEIKRRGFGLSVRGEYETAAPLFEAIIERGDCYSIAQLVINGQDLLNAGIKQGPQLGEKLNELLDMVIEDPSLNDKEILRRYI